MSETINFDELADLHQANVRAAQYHIKRFSAGKFNISNEGKAIIGLDPTKGVNIKYGNGHVLIATLPKDDKRASTLLHGVVGNGFTSNEFERILQDNNLVGLTYEFEFVAEYDGLKYYKLVIKRPVGDVEAMAAVTSDDASEPDTTDEQESNLAEADLQAESEESSAEAPEVIKNEEF